MKRRDFIQYASSSIVLPILLDGFGASAHNKPSTAFMAAIQEMADTSDRILIVVQLQGGNDGLNMVIPMDQYETYSSASIRGNIAIPEAKVLKLKNNLATGLHPAMTGLQKLYDEGKMSIVHACGYAKPNFSHNRATNIWQTGAENSNEYLTTGWLGRYLDDFNLNDYSDPLAIQIAATASATFNSDIGSPVLALQNPSSFISMVGSVPDIIDSGLPNSTAGNFTAFIRDQQRLSVKYASQLKVANEKGVNKVTYPTGNKLADQLKIVAKMIDGGLKTKVYYVSFGSFDTHSGQVEATDTTTGDHAELLATLSEGIATFMQDMKLQGNDHRIAGMTFSEFGRRAVSNGSRGTDHGWASPMFVFGNAVAQQNIGENPNLNDLENNNIKLQNEFRSVYAAILGDWMGASDQSVKAVLTNKDFSVAPIFKQTILANENPILARNFNVFPNPARSFATMESEFLSNPKTEWSITDMYGKIIRPNFTKIAPNKVRLDVSATQQGKYLINVNTPSGSIVKPLLVVK